MTSTIAKTRPGRPVVTPDDLIEGFCHIGDTGDLANPTLENGILTCTGNCRYEGGAGAALAVGFYDAYDFIHYLSSRGWTPLADKGGWPTEVVATFAIEGVYGVAEYREGDLIVSQPDSEDRYLEFCDSLS
jgi:hypothetical protein